MNGASAGRVRLAIGALREVVGVEVSRRRLSFSELLRLAHARTPRPGCDLAPSRGLCAVRRVRRALGLAPNCLLESLALVRLLRAHGNDARLEIGVRPDVRPLDAHAWVEIGGRAVESHEGPYRRLEPSRVTDVSRSSPPSHADASRALSSPSPTESV